MEENILNEEINNENIIEIYEKEYNELKAWKTKYLYLLADFDNYKKKIAKKDEERVKYINEDWFKTIINFFDDFDRVISNDVVPEGLKLSIRNLIKLCEDNGLHKIAHDKYFDVNLHNAVSTIEQTSLDDNEIVAWVKEGYMYKDKVLRYADVVVNKNNN